jgi:hypothetical protein
MSQPRRLTRSEAVEILTGLALMLGAIAWWNVPAAVFTAGAVLLAGSLFGRKVA